MYRPTAYYPPGGAPAPAPTAYSQPGGQQPFAPQSPMYYGPPASGLPSQALYPPQNPAGYPPGYLNPMSPTPAPITSLPSSLSGAPPSYGMSQPIAPEPSVSGRSNPLDALWGKKTAHVTAPLQAAPQPLTPHYETPAPPKRTGPRNYDIFRDMMEEEEQDQFGGFATAVVPPSAPQNVTSFAPAPSSLLPTPVLAPASSMEPAPVNAFPPASPSGLGLAPFTPVTPAPTMAKAPISVAAQEGGKVDESIFFSSSLTYKPSISTAAPVSSQSGSDFEYVTSFPTSPSSSFDPFSSSATAEPSTAPKNHPASGIIPPQPAPQPHTTSVPQLFSPQPTQPLNLQSAPAQPSVHLNYFAEKQTHTMEGTMSPLRPQPVSTDPYAELSSMLEGGIGLAPTEPLTLTSGGSSVDLPLSSPSFPELIGDHESIATSAAEPQITPAAPQRIDTGLFGAFQAQTPAPIPPSLQADELLSEEPRPRITSINSFEPSFGEATGFSSNLLSNTSPFQAGSAVATSLQPQPEDTDDDFGFGDFATASSDTAAAEPTPVESQAPEVIVGASSSLSISSVLELFVASTPESKEVKQPVMIPLASNVSTVSEPSQRQQPKKVDWTAVDPADLFGIESVSTEPAKPETISTTNTIEEDSDWSSFSSPPPTISPTPPPSQPLSPPALSSLIAPIPTILAIPAAAATLDDDFLGLGSPSSVKTAMANSKPKVASEDLFALFGESKQENTAAGSPAFFAFSPPPALASPNSELPQLLEKLIQQERLAEALACRSSLQSQRAPAEGLLAQWKAPPPSSHMTVAVMAEKLAAKSAAKANAFQSRFKEPLVQLAKKDLSEAAKRQAEATELFQKLLSETSRPTRITSQQLETWQTTLQFCLAEIEIADQFVRSALTKAKALSHSQALLDKVFLSQKAQDYFLGLSEVYFIACRLRISSQMHREALEGEAVAVLFSFIDQIAKVWTNLFAQLKSASIKVPGEKRAEGALNLSSNANCPCCTLCLLPAQSNDPANLTLVWDGKLYHTTCANFLSNRSCQPA